MPAPTLVAFAEAITTGLVTNASVTTASISWQTGDVVVVLVGTSGPVADTLNTPTTTGSGLSFTQRQLHNATGSDSGGGCWTAVATVGSSGTFTGSETGAAEDIVIGVYIFRGSAGVGNSQISTGSPRTASLTPTGADGSIAWCVFDWAADAVQSFTPTATTHGTSTPGPQASPASAQDGTNFTYYIADLDDQTSAGAVSYGIGGAGAGPFTIIAIEVKAGLAGGVLPVRPGKTWQRRYRHRQQRLTPSAAVGPQQFQQSLTAGLSFTGADNQLTSTHQAGTLSFTGTVTRLTIKAALTAALSFVGALVRQVNSHQTGGLSFTGALPRAISTHLTATLTFVSALLRRTSTSLAGATLSFTGGLTKRTSTLRTATLSFTGSLVSQAVHHFTQALSATLSFTGALTTHNVLNKALSATLSFTGAQTRQVGTHLAGALSFTGGLARQVGTHLAGGLSFTGARSSRVTSGQASQLNFAGQVTKRTATVRTATLSFAGTLTSLAVHHFTQALSATLSFAGQLTTQHTFAKALSAALGFTGSVSRRVAPQLAASLSFTGARTVRVAHQLAATLSPSGLLTIVPTLTSALSGLFIRVTGRVGRLLGLGREGTTNAAGELGSTGAVGREPPTGYLGREGPGSVAGEEDGT